MSSLVVWGEVLHWTLYPCNSHVRFRVGDLHVYSSPSPHEMRCHWFQRNSFCFISPTLWKSITNEAYSYFEVTTTQYECNHCMLQLEVRSLPSSWAFLLIQIILVSGYIVWVECGVWLWFKSTICSKENEPRIQCWVNQSISIHELMSHACEIFIKGNRSRGSSLSL